MVCFKTKAVADPSAEVLTRRLDVAQASLERCVLYAQQQAAVLAAGATSIQAAWRGRQARRCTAVLQATRQQQRQQEAAATVLQVSVCSICKTLPAEFAGVCLCCVRRIYLQWR